MKKRHILNLLLCLFMFFSSFTVKVKAAGLSYLVSENGERTSYGFSYYSSGQYMQGFEGYDDNIPVKAYVLVNSSNWSGSSSAIIKVVFITDSATKYYWGSDVNPHDLLRDINTYSEEYNVYWRVDYANVPRYNQGSAVVNVVENLANMTIEDMFNYVMTNGGYAPSTNWGNPADVNISTIYSGNVQSSPSNIDKFTWNNNVDSNGISYISHLDEHPVIEVQAVPVTWKTSTREEMENNSGGDPTIGTGVALDSYNARTGHLEITWQEVINYLQIEYADIYSYFFDGTYWIMKGWFYQIRLVTDNYTGEWITLSNGLNLTPKKSKKLIEDPYDETTYNLLKEISETNDQTTTVYEYGDNYITINNDPSSGWQDPDGGGSFWDFLASVVKAISDGIASIVSSFASLVGDLVNGILGLFTFDTFEINNYNTEVQTLKDNSGIFGQSIEFADSIKDSIRGVEQQPAVLHFDGIVIDDVQLIPAVDLDFDQMVVDAGLTDFHNLVYVFTDGTILISLIIMVHHKVMEVLRK